MSGAVGPVAVIPRDGSGGHNRSKLDSLAAALLEHETLDENAVYAAAGVPRTDAPTADSYTTAAQSRTQG
jgi:hypothetical protein